LHNFHVIEERAHLPAGAGHRFEKSKSWTDRGISRVYQYSSHRCREWLPTHFITVKGRNSYMCFVHWRHCKETPIQPQWVKDVPPYKRLPSRRAFNDTHLIIESSVCYDGCLSQYDHPRIGINWNTVDRHDEWIWMAIDGVTGRCRTWSVELAYSCLSTPSGGLGMLNRRLVRFPITRSSATIAALSDIRKVHFDRVALFVSAEEDERL
jgi:hypothetical protein